MAMELKNAADRYELLKKEHEDKSADLSKALNATKEIRTELRGAREELQQAGKIAAGGSYLLQVKVFGSEVCSSGSTLESYRRVCGLGEEYN